MIKVTKESPTGRNEKFLDTVKNKEMTRGQFVKEIDNGNYKNFIVKNINGKKTPVSKPDGNSKNNLG